jgi:hypothetical protein
MIPTHVTPRGRYAPGCRNSNRRDPKRRFHGSGRDARTRDHDYDALAEKTVLEFDSVWLGDRAKRLGVAGHPANVMSSLSPAPGRRGRPHRQARDAERD